MPNNRMRSGVINDPPPTPVMPTRRPTLKPDATKMGSIADIRRVATNRSAEALANGQTLKISPLLGLPGGLPSNIR